DKELRKRREGTKGQIRIGLHFITSYTQKEQTENDQINTIKKYKKDIPSMLERLYDDFCGNKKTTAPDVIACWMPPQEMVLSHERKHTLPGLIVMVKLFQPIP
ncbi:MAG: hypothetical protein K2O46_04275, partial [Bacteroidales bacterium]|nr:hypothetical protein [Bacteroidales bacterium]